MTHLKRLKDQRRILQHSQEYIANHLGISQKAYSDIENGKSILKHEYILKLSEILQIQISELCNISEKCSHPCNSKVEDFKKLLMLHGVEIPEYLR